MSKPLTIGRLAKAANVNIETIRYYQRISLLDEPKKPLSGYRVYPENYISRIHFIKKAQRMGFKLSEIAELIQLDDGQCENVRERAERKRQQIDQQIIDLKSLRKTLDVLIQTCHTKGQNQHCPIIETLSS